MATDHQIALTRAQRMPAPLSKAARQVVPAFLQKLYEMVNDPKNAELIRWSDAGDSFFVLDHERLAHEVLGRWFKHKNFNSFVRQLNMYGFHKIPHLQQGVLKSDTETEFWNFAHANFHRGQPDLLCLIQRKKPQLGDEGIIDLRDGNAAAGMAALTGAQGTAGAQGGPALSSGQILDIQSILNGLTAIKRHQTTISSELNELKRSNQLLWQDALTSRAKHQKQQDTINRIVKFLAGVFGHSSGGNPGAGGGKPGVSSGPHGKDDTNAAGMGPMMRRKALLMIEDAKRDGPLKTAVEELSEIPMELDTSLYNTNYPSIETPGSAPSPSPSVGVSENTPITENSPYFATPTPTQSTNSGTAQPENSPSPTDPQNKEISRAVTPSRTPSFDFDPRIQNVFSQLSPVQVQALLASLAAQTINDPNLSAPPTVNPAATTNSNGLLTQYHQPPSFDYSLNPAHSAASSYNPPSMPLISPDGLIPFEHYDPSGDVSLNMINDMQQDQRLASQWNAAEDISKDVNAVDSHLKTLIQDFGLDPSLLDEGAGRTGPTPPSSDTPSNDNMMNGHPAHNAAAPSTDPTDPTPWPITNPTSDLDIEAFFRNLSSLGLAPGAGGPGNTELDGIMPDHAMVGAEGEDYGDLAATSFLDEVPTPIGSNASDVTSSPVQPLRHVSPDPASVAGSGSVNVTALAGGGAVQPKSPVTGKKRKSDVMMMDLGREEEVGAVSGSGSGPIPGGELLNLTNGSSKTGNKSKRRKDK